MDSADINAVEVREGRETKRSRRKSLTRSLSLRRKKKEKDSETSEEQVVEKTDLRKVPLLVVLELQEISGFSQTDQNYYQIVWRRGGKKENQGKTKKKSSALGLIDLRKNLQFLCTANQKISSSKFYEKTIAFVLKKESPATKKISTVSSALLNLATFFASPSSTPNQATVSFGCVDGRAIEMTVQITVIPDCSREESIQERRSKSRSRSSSRSRKRLSIGLGITDQKELEARVEAHIIRESDTETDTESEIDINETSDIDEENPFVQDDFNELMESYRPIISQEKNASVRNRSGTGVFQHNPDQIYVYFPQDELTKEIIEEKQLRMISLLDFSFSEKEMESEVSVEQQSNQKDYNNLLERKNNEILELEADLRQIECKLVSFDTNTIKELQIEIEHSNKQLGNAEEQLNATKSLLDEKEEEIVTLKQKLESLLGEKQKLSSMVEQSSTAENKRQLQLSSMKDQEIEELRTNNENLSKENRRREAKIKELSEILEEKQKAITEREKKYVSLLTISNEAEKENKVLSKTNKIQQRQIEDLTTQTNHLRAEIKESHEEITSLKKEKQESAIRLTGLQQELAEVKNSLQQKNEITKEELKKLTDELEQCKHENQSLRDQEQSQKKIWEEKMASLVRKVELSDARATETTEKLEQQQKATEQAIEKKKEIFESKRVLEIELERCQHTINSSLDSSSEREEEMKEKLSLANTKIEKLEEQVKRLSLGQKSMSASQKETITQLEKYQARSEELQRQNRLLMQQIVHSQTKYEQSNAEHENKQHKLLEAFQLLSEENDASPEIHSSFGEEITSDELYILFYHVITKQNQQTVKWEVERGNYRTKQESLLCEIEECKKEKDLIVLEFEQATEKHQKTLNDVTKKLKVHADKLDKFFNVERGDDEKEIRTGDDVDLSEIIERMDSTLIVFGDMDHDDSEDEMDDYVAKLSRFAGLVGTSGSFSLEKGSRKEPQKPLSYTQLSEKLSKAEIEILSRQMIKENIHSVTFDGSVCDRATTICTFLSVMENDVWVSQQLHTIHEAILYSYEHTYSNIDGLVYWMTLVSSLLHQLQSQTNLLKFTGDINATGILSESDMSVQREERALERLAFDIYTRIKAILMEHIDFTAKPAVFGQPTLPNQIKSLETWHNPVSPKRLLQPFYELLDSCQRYKLCSSVAQQLFSLYYWYLDAVLFNELIGKSALCSIDVALQMKSNLYLFTTWNETCDDNYRTSLSFAQECLGHVTDAANLFLTISNETMFENTTVLDMFSNLNLAQIKHLVDLFSRRHEVPTKILDQIDETCSSVNIGNLPLLCPTSIPLHIQPI